jgi:trehalose/maltose transport system substrate-binding protein
LAVTQTSAHRREAIELIRFLLKRDDQLRRSLGDPPKEPLLSELPAILSPYPKAAKSMTPGAEVAARPSAAAGSKYEDVSRAYIRAAHSVLTGEERASVAAAALEKELVAITGFATRQAPVKPGSQRRD